MTCATESPVERPKAGKNLQTKPKRKEEDKFFYGQLSLKKKIRLYICRRKMLTISRGKGLSRLSVNANPGKFKRNFVQERAQQVDLQ